MKASERVTAYIVQVFPSYPFRDRIFKVNTLVIGIRGYIISFSTVCN